MKTYIKKKIALSLFLIFVINSTFSQDLESSIENDNYIHQLFKPIQSGNTFMFNIKVENRSYTETDTIRIDEKTTFTFGTSLFKLIDTGVKIVKPRQTVKFQVKVSSLKHEPNGEWSNLVSLDKFTKKDNEEGEYKSLGFLGNPFKVTIDNEPPTDVQISKKSLTENEIVVSVKAYDRWSRDYTFWKPDAGVDGVAKVNIKLKDSYGVLIEQEDVEVKEHWKDIRMQLHSTLTRGTTYTLYATATDVAGNTSEPATTTFTTDFDPPTNLTAEDIGYSDFVLHWKATQGATSYEVYEVTDSKEKFVATTTETNLYIKDLEMGKTYEYAVKAKVNNTTSNYSATLSVTTEYTRILGNRTICDQEVYTIDNFLPNTKVEWSASNTNLELVSVEENGKKAIFSKKDNGMCSVNVTIKGISKVLEKEIVVGIPLASEIGVSMKGQTLGKLPYIILSNFDFPERIIESNLVTLCTTKDNIFDAEYPKKNSSGKRVLTIQESLDFFLNPLNLEYEWRIKYGSQDWSLEDYYADFFPYGPHNSAVVKYINEEAIPSYDPIFEVRVSNDCGCSEWKELSNFYTKSCEDWDLDYFLSPNGDGVNDTFEIVQKRQIFNRSSTSTPIFNLTIFNKNGEVVYQKENYMQDAEHFYGVGNVGSFAGTELPDGDYFFSITGSENRSGNIYLKRE